MLSAKQQEFGDVSGLTSASKSVGIQEQKSIVTIAETSGTNQVPQMRVLQAVVSKSVPRQDHITTFNEQTMQILRAIPSHSLSEVQVIAPHTNSTPTCITRFPLSSPKKGTVISIPTGRIVTQTSGAAKLRVGDTVVIPTKTLHSIKPEKVQASEPIVLKNSSGQLLFTPTKLIQSQMDTTVMTSPVAMRSHMPQEHSISARGIHASPARAEAASPMVWTPSPRYKRSVDTSHQDTPETVKRNRRTPGAEKGNKGLRHFAMLVCEKVKQKNTTTYNEVADELVTEYSNSQSHLNDQQYDQKNIRRRVYDALNVLMAMNIIYKDKKDIHWVGLPTNSVQELKTLQTEKSQRELRIKQKTAQLHELILQQIAFKSLVARNRMRQQMQGPPPANSTIQLPFIIVNTSKKTVIDCSISNDKYEYLFNFDNTFEIHDDIEVLKRMGMAYGLENGVCSRQNLNAAKQLVPPVLQPYLEDMATSSETNNGGEYSGQSSSHKSLASCGNDILSQDKTLRDCDSILMIQERSDDSQPQELQRAVKAEFQFGHSMSPMNLNT